MRGGTQAIPKSRSAPLLWGLAIPQHVLSLEQVSKSPPDSSEEAGFCTSVPCVLRMGFRADFGTYPDVSWHAIMVPLCLRPVGIHGSTMDGVVIERPDAFDDLVRCLVE